MLVEAPEGGVQPQQLRVVEIGQDCRCPLQLPMLPAQ